MVGAAQPFLDVQLIVGWPHTVIFLSKIPVTLELFMSCKESLVKAEEEFCGRGGYAGNRTVCVYLTLVLCVRKNTDRKMLA